MMNDNAKAITEQVMESVLGNKGSVYAIIAAALDAETERCAKIAEQFYSDPIYRDSTLGILPKEIAAAIRQAREGA